MPMQFTGAEFTALAQDFERLAQVADPARATSIMEEAAQPILERMKANASSNPHPRSGRLVGAINTGPPTKKNGGITVTVGVHRRDWPGDPYYPAYVELGHGGPHPAPPHPYVRPAYDAAAPEAYERLRALLDQALK